MLLHQHIWATQRSCIRRRVDAGVDHGRPRLPKALLVPFCPLQPRTILRDLGRNQADGRAHGYEQSAIISCVSQPQSAGAVLRAARTGAGLSQAALAARSGVSQSVISVYEAGRRQPSLPMLANLVEAAGCDLELRVHPRPMRARLRGPIGRRLLKQRAGVLKTVERHGVRLLGVFGSVSRGEDTPCSDIDLLVTVPEGMGLLGLGRVEKELSELLAARVDLVPADGLKPAVRRNVLADLVVL